MKGFEFSKLLSNWSSITPPLRPNEEVVAAIEALIDDRREPALLLGVTPEFADLSENLVAVDINPDMVAALWPGDTANRRAVVGDWQHMGFGAQTFSLCLGDGCFTVPRYPDELAQLLAEIARVLRPGGRVVCRVFACPEIAETAEALRDAAQRGEIKSFHTFKWRLGMMLAVDHQGFNVPLPAMLDAFNAMFSDRDRLVQLTGWNRKQIDAIDLYAGSPSTFGFAPRRSLAKLASDDFVNIRFVPSGTYELAECCPLMVMERR